MPLGAALGLWKIFLFLNWMKWNSKEKKILNLFFRRMCAYDFLHRENFRGRTAFRLILWTKKTAPYNFFKLSLSHYFSTIFRMMTSPTQSKRSVTSLWRHQKRVKMKYRPNMVVWYINGKLWFQRFQIWNCFWPMTSSRDVIKEKPLKMGISGRFYHSTLSFDVCYRTILSWNSSYTFYTTCCGLPW